MTDPNIVPDPEYPKHQALDDQGRVMYGVFATELDDEGRPLPDSKRRHVGWCYGVSITPLPAPERED